MIHIFLMHNSHHCNASDPSQILMISFQPNLLRTRFLLCMQSTRSSAGSRGPWFIITHTRVCMQKHAVHHSLHTHTLWLQGRVIHGSHLSPGINHPRIIITVTTIAFIVVIIIITVPAVMTLICTLLWLWHALFSLTAVSFRLYTTGFLMPQVNMTPRPPINLPSLHPSVNQTTNTTSKLNHIPSLKIIILFPHIPV